MGLIMLVLNVYSTWLEKKSAVDLRKRRGLPELRDKFALTSELSSKDEKPKN